MRLLRPAPVLLLALALVAGACSDDPSPAEELAEARAVWEAHDLDDYRFIVRGGVAWPDYGRFLVTVEGTRVTPRLSGSPEGANPEAVWTKGGIDDLFALIEERMSRDDAEHLHLRFHPTWGFPIRIGFDNPEWVDEEWGYTIVAFAPAGEPLAYTDPDEQACGYRLDGIWDRLGNQDPDLIDAAAEAALADTRLGEFLILHGGCRISAVRFPDAADGPVLVAAHLDPPAATADWPLDHCGAGGDTTPLTGIAWLVDRGTVAEASPVWGTAHCLSPLPTDRVPVPTYRITQVCEDCGLDSDQVRRAVRIALGDGRLHEFLMFNSFYVTGVHHRPADEAISTDGAVVDITLRTPVVQAVWPGDYCAIGHDVEEVTGVRWLIDLDGRRISAVSPVWGDVACGY